MTTTQKAYDLDASALKASYRDNYERLAAIKSKYDPTNFFRVNQNIKPTT
jgi:FAD/FMN-containing dehydrogenase